LNNKKTSVEELKLLVTNGAVKPANAGSNASDGYGDSRVEHVFVPMASIGTMHPGKDQPVHTMEVTTRGEVLKEWFSSPMRDGTYAAIYRAYFWAIVCFVLTIITMQLSVYVAAVFAFLTGYFWSERLLNDAWSLEWYKGKALYHTV